MPLNNLLNTKKRIGDEFVNNNTPPVAVGSSHVYVREIHYKNAGEAMNLVTAMHDLAAELAQANIAITVGSDESAVLTNVIYSYKPDKHNHATDKAAGTFHIEVGEKDFETLRKFFLDHPSRKPQLPSKDGKSGRVSP